MTALAARIKKEQGGCDVLINNAGLYHYTQNPTPEQRREMLDINFRGTLLVRDSFTSLIGSLMGKIIYRWREQEI